MPDLVRGAGRQMLVVDTTGRRRGARTWKLLARRVEMERVLRLGEEVEGAEVVVEVDMVDAE